MSICFFEGPAGSGKTTRLFHELNSILDIRPLLKNERVLALTKMHGSRRRMQERFLALPGLSGKFECATMDSFAYRVLRRWRSLAFHKGGGVPPADDYEECCRIAGALLCDPVVGHWVTRTFPIFVIDEMQDSKDGQLDMVCALSESATCLAAADDYQDLDASGLNAAVLWAQQNGQVVSLTQNHRTTATGLLEASSALRYGLVVPSKSDGFVVLGAMNKHVGASYLSRNLTWWRKSHDIVVLSPVGPERSGFVREIIHRVEEKPISKPAVGPHRIPWEATQEDECEKLLACLMLPAEPSATVCISQLCLPDNIPLSKTLHVWFDQQRRLAGRTTFTVTQIKNQVRFIHQRSRAYHRARYRGVRAMTIHQAKNREFNSVIVLWPYEVVGSADRQRRLLYNAITRAKCQAVVIVQNPDRLKQPPFVPD